MFLRLMALLFCFLPVILLAQDPPSPDNVIVEEEITKEFAPDFEMTMVDGTKKNLSDFKGQVIYLSFWASWCKPCISGFKKYREMRKNIEELGVVMLNVSIDEKSENWKSAIKAHQPTGTHAHIPQAKVQDDYQLYSVPLYEIIGKDGEFLYLSDEPGRDILENFRQFME